MLYRYNENPDLEQLQIGDDLEVRLEDLNVEDSNTLSEKLEQALQRMGDQAAMLTFVDSWGVDPPRTLCTFKFVETDNKASYFVNCPEGPAPSAVTLNRTICTTGKR